MREESMEAAWGFCERADGDDGEGVSRVGR